MKDLFNLDVNSVEIVNASKTKVSHKDRLNDYVKRFSKLIEQYLDNPNIYDELLLIFKAIKYHGDYLQDSNKSVFAIRLDNGWYKVKKDDPSHLYEDTPWAYYVKEKLTYGIISVADRLELDDLIRVYRDKRRK